MAILLQQQRGRTLGAFYLLRKSFDVHHDFSPRHEDDELGDKPLWIPQPRVFDKLGYEFAELTFVSYNFLMNRVVSVGELRCGSMEGAAVVVVRLEPFLQHVEQHKQTLLWCAREPLHSALEPCHPLVAALVDIRGCKNIFCWVVFVKGHLCDAGSIDDRIGADAADAVIIKALKCGVHDSPLGVKAG